jgi:hypothetical protein
VCGGTRADSLDSGTPSFPLLGREGIARNQPSHRTPVPGNQDLFACFGTVEEATESILCLKSAHRQHAFPPQLVQLKLA